ncbi:MAG: ATP-binding protein [Actinomycetota bacterium]
MGGSGTSGTERVRGGLSPEELRTERSVALIRMAVVLVVAIVYLNSGGMARITGRLAVSILALAALYSVWSLLARPHETVWANRFRAAVFLADAVLITMWCLATGGPASEYWALYLIAIIAVAMRFDVLETLFSALGLAVLYVLVMSVSGGLSRTALLSRPALMLITGWAVGALAKQRRTNQDQREVLVQIAEDRSRALAEEQAMVTRLREVDLAKTEFVAVAAHELRTPLATILGVMGTLRTHRDDLDPSIREELLEGAQVQAQRLARLVEDLLTVSRIEDGALRLDVRPANLGEMIAEAVQASATADIVRVELNGIAEVHCDRDRMVRVVTNLLDNARKYSPPDGHVFITVTEDERFVTFGVRDQGPGIPKEQREEVFERFRRLADEPDRPGSGLGLYIARCLVEAHGGSIRVEESAGGGAEFLFTLPKAQTGGAPSAPRPSATTSV